MPLYQASGSITALYPGDTGVLALAEAIVTGTKSLQFALAQNPDGSHQSFSIVGKFSGLPGAFSFAVQTADEDSDSKYVNEPSLPLIVAADVANNEFRVEAAPIKALFARLSYVAQPGNVVTFTGRITR